MAVKTKTGIVSNKNPLKNIPTPKKPVQKKEVDGEVPAGVMNAILPLCQKLRAIKDKKDELSIEEKKLNAEEEYIEQILVTKMTSEGLSSVKTIYGTASTSEKIVPSIKDFDTAIAWIIKNKRFELLPKSVKSAAWKESYEAGEVIPGIEAVKIDKLSFRRTPSKGSAANA